MHITISVSTEDDHGNTTNGDANLSAPAGQIEIILIEPGITVTIDPKELIPAIKNSLLDELGLL